jgi:hypothetical protein
MSSIALRCAHGRISSSVRAVDVSFGDRYTEKLWLIRARVARVGLRRRSASVVRGFGRLLFDRVREKRKGDAGGGVSWCFGLRAGA